MDKRLILAIQYVCNERAIVLPWDAIGKHLDVTPGAISQHMAKLRQRLVSWGFGVPPPLRRSSGFGYASSSRALEKASRGPNAERAYEIGVYNEEDDEEEEDPDIKEEEDDEESDIEMSEFHTVKEGRRKAPPIEEEDDGDGFEPLTRIQPTRRAKRKQTLERRESSRADLLDDLYVPPGKTKIQGRARERLRLEEVASTPKSHATNLTQRDFSGSEETAVADSVMRIVGVGEESPSDVIKNNEHSHAEMEDMFSEFSRPIGIDGSGSAKLVGMLADSSHSPTHRSSYSPIRRSWDQEQWPADEPTASWDDGRLYNSINNNQRTEYEFSGGVGNELLINPDSDEMYLEQNHLNATTPTDGLGPLTTPKNGMPYNQYNSSATARNLPLPLGPAAVGCGERSQHIVPAPLSRVVTQHRLAQPDSAPSREVRYQTPNNYAYFGASISTLTETANQEPGGGSEYGGRNVFSNQFYGGVERPQFDGLDSVPLAEENDPFAGMNLGYSSYLGPEGAMNEFDALSKGFIGYD
ncbi:hypothetical protein GP486_007526 [Trichoglossum hirsutum]|uniref:Uncharacterized protein n=1 Tax=Trichoglossum hirsutum TaxID=265104 RepID=A0A9P8IFC7_9PEZI|nr:hypothetical protein GP486_007526 [Trichoglossum hirsutum]